MDTGRPPPCVKGLGAVVDLRPTGMKAMVWARLPAMDLGLKWLLVPN